MIRRQPLFSACEPMKVCRVLGLAASCWLLLAAAGCWPLAAGGAFDLISASLRTLAPPAHQVPSHPSKETRQAYARTLDGQCFSPLFTSFFGKEICPKTKKAAPSTIIAEDDIMMLIIFLFYLLAGFGLGWSWSLARSLVAVLPHHHHPSYITYVSHHPCCQLITSN
jgi:hypothetical protein